MTKKNINVITYVLSFCMVISLYVVIYIMFFGFMAINNPQVINISRTAAVTLITYSFLIIAMNTIYGRPDIGNKKRRSIWASTTLSVIITDLFTYFVLQIMNVNSANNQSLVLFGDDFKLLIYCIVLQVAWIYTLTLISDRIYYLLVPPKESCIISDSQENADHVAEKLIAFKEQFKLNDVLQYDCSDTKETILKNDVVFISNLPDNHFKDIQMFCYENNKTIYVEPTIDKLILSTANKTVLDDAPLLNIANNGLSLNQKIVKRIIDLLASIVGIILTSPIMLVSAIIIKVYDNGPVFFKQARATLNGEVFNIIKFRTMDSNIDIRRGSSISVQANDDRITKPGVFLRKTRIDELPQLFNILSGKMSLVGPRPEMLSNIEKYTNEIPEFVYRQKVKCGLTGLAQIDGKYNTTAKDKLLLDLFYIENFSILSDIKLIFRTLTVFFKKDSTEAFCSNKVNTPTLRRISIKSEKKAK